MGRVYPPPTMCPQCKAQILLLYIIYVTLYVGHTVGIVYTPPHTQTFLV